MLYILQFIERVIRTKSSSCQCEILSVEYIKIRYVLQEIEAISVTYQQVHASQGEAMIHQRIASTSAAEVACLYKPSKLIYKREAKYRNSLSG